MATRYSAQVAGLVNAGRTAQQMIFSPGQNQAVRRLVYASYDNAAAVLVNGDEILLGMVPVGSRVLPGRFANTAMGASVTIALRLGKASGADGQVLLAAASMASAGANDIGETIAKGFGYVAPIGEVLAPYGFVPIWAVVGGANPTGGEIRLDFEYAWQH